MTIDFAKFEFFSTAPATHPAAKSGHRGARRPGRPLLARALAGLAHVLTRAARAVSESAERRAVLGELARLSDRELADIGLTRGDLPMLFDPVFGAKRQAARNERTAGLRSA